MDHQRAPPSDRELSRWPRHMRTHVRRRRTAHARPSAPILSPASVYGSAGFLVLDLAPRLMLGPVLLRRSRSELWKLILNALSPLCKALPPFPAETVQRLSSLKPGTLLLRDHQNLFREPAWPLGTRGLELVKRRVLRVVLGADRGSQLSYCRAPG